MKDNNAYDDMSQMRVMDMGVNNSSPASLKDHDHHAYDQQQQMMELDVNAPDKFSESNSGQLAHGSNAAKHMHCNRVSNLSKDAN